MSRVSGWVTLKIRFSVNELETDNIIGINTPVINDADVFFGEWVDAWNRGEGELSSVYVVDNDLYFEDDDGDED